MYGIFEYVNELVVFFSLRIQTDVKIHLATRGDIGVLVRINCLTRRFI